MKLNKIMKFWIALIVMGATTTSVFAQDKIIDQIVAIVGGNIILKSDVEYMNIQQQAQGMTSEGDMKCEILENLLIDRLLIAEAELDTLIDVTPNQVNQQMDQQIQMYISRLGSEKAVEEYFSKPIALIKSDMQEGIRNQLLSSQMQNKIVQDVTATPSEVRYNFRNMEEDDIPSIPTKYEYAQITIKPEISIEEENRVKSQLRDLKHRAEEGANFASLAIMYSEEPGASRTGGELPYYGRGELDPSYAAAAFNLKPGKISNVVKSEFGYHIIQQINKQGEKVKTRHILMRAKPSVEAKEQAFERLDSLANMLRKNEIPFDHAAMMFSSDKNSRNSGGDVINPNTMSSSFSVQELESDVSKVLTKMNINEISQPFESIDPTNQQPVYKIIKLVNKTKEHKANIQDDYQQLADMYLAKKKEEELQKWIAERQSETYIRIDDTYANCNFRFKSWIK